MSGDWTGERHVGAKSLCDNADAATAPYMAFQRMLAKELRAAVVEIERIYAENHTLELELEDLEHDMDT